MEEKRLIKVLELSKISYLSNKNLTEQVEIQCVRFEDDCNKDVQRIKKLAGDIIIIYAEEDIGYINNKIYGSIEFLIWLRIKEEFRHIMVISSGPLIRIMKSNDKIGFILSSAGVSFWEKEKTDFKRINYSGFVTEKANKDNLKSYLSSIIDITKSRHEYANIWGLKRLVDIHKKYNKNFNDKGIDYGKTESSLSYQIAEYIYKNEDVYKQKDDDTEKAIKRLNDALSDNQNVEVLFIDDKADTGWKSIIESLLKKNIKCLKLSVNSSDNLMNKFETQYDSTKIDVVISDLRLYKEEETMTDYDKFKSIVLMRAIFDKKENRRLKYNTVRYILFTASNQLMNYKNVIKSNRYAPSGIYIKEGFDHIINEEQQEVNYRSLINALTSAISENYNKKGGRVETGSFEEQIKIQAVKDNIDSDNWKRTCERIKKTLEEYDHVILDTNIFYDEEPYIALCGSTKIRCFFPVFKEMERIIDTTREVTYRAFAAQKAINIHKDDIFFDSLTDADISLIKSKFDNKGEDLRDLADNYFVPAIEKLFTDNKILFLTNDNGPYSKTRKWLIKHDDVIGVKVLKTNEFYNSNGIWPRKLKISEHPTAVNIEQRDVNATGDTKRNKLIGCEKSKNGNAYNILLDNNKSVSVPITMLSIKKRVTDIEGFNAVANKTYSYKTEWDLVNIIINNWSALPN